MSEHDAPSLAEMDEQIHYYHVSQALSLKLQRNKRAPVSKLSQDVLLEIFLTARDFTEDQNLSKTALRVSHVCKAWRYIAIDAPTLWTRPPTHHCRLQWTDLTLQRAKMAPLDVLLNFDRSNPATNKLVLSKISHITKLVIKGMSHKLVSLPELMSEKAPQLRELQIFSEVFEEDFLEEDEDFDGIEPLLPPEAFRDAPQLQRLTLKHVDFDLDSPLFSNLISLSLKSLPSSAVSAWVQLTDALRRMPLLEELMLDSVFPAPTASVFDLKVVDLPHLKIIGAHTRTESQLQVFMSLLAFPRPEHLSLSWKRDNISGHSQAESIFRTVAHLVDAKKHGNSFTTLELCADDQQGFRCVARSPEGCSIEIGLRESPEESESRDLKAATDFVYTLHLTGITHISIDTHWHEYDLRSLYALLDELPLLQTATVMHLTAFNFFNCLGAQQLYRYPNPPEEFSMRNLKSITWKNGDFSGYQDWVRETVEDILEGRREKGFPLLELTFENVANLTPALIKIFEEGIPKVIVAPTATPW